MATKEPTNEKQVAFFDEIFGNGGDIPAACEKVGYDRSYGYSLARKYRDYILERAEGAVHLKAVRAAELLGEVLDDDGTLPNTKHRMDAAIHILDRAGIVKTDRIKMEVEAPSGIFILPQKEVSDG